MVTLYVDKKLMVTGVRPIPLLMHLTPADRQPELLYWNELRSRLQNSNISILFYENADEIDGVMLIPHYLNDYSKQQLAAVTNASNRAKHVVAFHDGSTHSITKHFALDSKLNNTNGTKRSVSIPAWLYDFSVSDKHPDISTATLSFVGNTSYPGKLNSAFQHIPLPIAIINTLGGNLLLDSHLPLMLKQVVARYVRQAVAKQIQKFSKIQTTLIQRSGAFFHLPSEEKQKRKKEHRNAIADNLYTVCVRGDQNGFFQLYEVMASGRIPVIIDTNTCLPTLKQYRWEDFALIVLFKEIESLEEQLLHFHDSHTEEELLRKCEFARLAYKELLPHNFVFSTILPAIQKLETANNASTLGR